MSRKEVKRLNNQVFVINYLLKVFENGPSEENNFYEIGYFSVQFLFENDILTIPRINFKDPKISLWFNGYVLEFYVVSEENFKFYVKPGALSLKSRDVVEVDLPVFNCKLLLSF